MTREIYHNQVRSKDAATRDGVANAPVAIAEAKAKAEIAKQEKDTKKWLQVSPNHEAAQRPALAAAAAEDQHVDDGDVPPPPGAYGTSNAKGGQGSNGWQGQ